MSHENPTHWDDDDEYPCIHNWDGNYPGEDDTDDTPYMLEDDHDEATSLHDECPF